VVLFRNLLHLRLCLTETRLVLKYTLLPKR